MARSIWIEAIAFTHDHIGHCKQIVCFFFFFLGSPGDKDIIIFPRDVQWWFVSTVAPTTTNVVVVSEWQQHAAIPTQKHATTISTQREWIRTLIHVATRYVHCANCWKLLSLTQLGVWNKPPHPHGDSKNTHTRTKIFYFEIKQERWDGGQQNIWLHGCSWSWNRCAKRSWG